MVHFTDWLPTLRGGRRRDPAGRRLALDGDDIHRCCAGAPDEVRRERFWQCNRYAPRVEGNSAMRDGDWKLVRPAIAELMQVTETDRAVDRALNYRQPERIATIDTSPLPEFTTGSPPAPLLFDLASDPFEHARSRGGASRPCPPDERRARTLV